VLISLLASAVFFLPGCYAQIAGFHFDVAAGAPLAALAAPGAYDAAWLGRLVELVILLDMPTVSIGVSAPVTRGVLTLARDG
jgi:hypothetical protein